MAKLSAPDFPDLEIPMNRWTEPFWQAAALRELKLPRCGECETFRWPPGPFCPNCSSQAVEWVPAGAARLYSYTIVRRGADENGAEIVTAPGLVEFPASGGVRIMAAIVGCEPSELRTDAPLRLDWGEAGGRVVPVFMVAYSTVMTSMEASSI